MPIATMTGLRTLGCLQHYLVCPALPLLRPLRRFTPLSQVTHFLGAVKWRRGVSVIPLSTNVLADLSSLHAARSFHTTHCRQIPPVLWMFVKPVAKAITIITGRYARIRMIDDNQLVKIIVKIP